MANGLLRDWGWLTQSDLKPEYADVMMKLKEGETSAAFTAEGHVVLLHLVDRRDFSTSQIR